MIIKYPVNDEILSLFSYIIDSVDIGIFVVNRANEIIIWNKFMAVHSGVSTKQAVGFNLFESFPELPEKWLKRKIENVFILKNFSFTSWEQRPYLFNFSHHRPITGNIDCMRQNCTFIPVKGSSDDIDYVCITLFDVTDTSIYEESLKSLTLALTDANAKDGLTKIFNRRYLETELEKEFERSKRYKTDYSVIMMDIDYFKKINDTHGHLGGDRVLCTIAQELQSGLRKTDIVGRYGGEEFLAILPETPCANAVILAERLRQHVMNTPIKLDGADINITVSIGVAGHSNHYQNYDEVLSNADKALYESKNSGRNRVTTHIDNPAD